MLKSIEFYEKAFGFKRKFIAPGNSCGELNTVGTTRSFASTGLAKSNLKEGFIESSTSKNAFAIEIAFTPDNVEEVYRNSVKEGAIPESPATLKPHGQCRIRKGH